MRMNAHDIGRALEQDPNARPRHLPPVLDPRETLTSYGRTLERNEQIAAVRARLEERAARFNVARYHKFKSMTESASRTICAIHERLQHAKDRQTKIGYRYDEFAHCHPGESWQYETEKVELTYEARELEAVVDRAKQELREVEANSRAVSELTNRIEVWLTEQSVLGTYNERAHVLHGLGESPLPERVLLPAPPTRRKGSFRDALVAQRARLADLKAERVTVEQAPRPLEEAAATIDAWIAARARRRPAAGAMFASAGADVRAMSVLSLPLSVYESTSIDSIFCWLLPEKVREVMLGDVQRHLEAHPPGLPEAERAAKIEALDAAIYEVELAEEALLRASERGGFALLPRGDADLRAVLAFDREGAPEISSAEDGL